MLYHEQWNWPFGHSTRRITKPINITCWQAKLPAPASRRDVEGPPDSLPTRLARAPAISSPSFMERLLVRTQPENVESVAAPRNGLEAAGERATQGLPAGGGWQPRASIPGLMIGLCVRSQTEDIKTVPGP
jgi:hypothetical protein